jgi:hypothetical protein
VVSFYVTMLLTLGGFVFLIGTTGFLSPSRRHALVGASAMLLAALGTLLVAAAMRESWSSVTRG